MSSDRKTLIKSNKELVHNAPEGRAINKRG